MLWGPSGDILTLGGGGGGDPLGAHSSMAGDAPSGDTVGPGSLPPRCPQGQSPRLTQHLLSCSPKPINRGATGATPPPGTGVPPRPSTMGVRKPPPENAEKLTKGGGEKKKKAQNPVKETKRRRKKPTSRKYLKTLSSVLLLLNQPPGEEAAAAGGVPAQDWPPGHHRATTVAAAGRGYL